LSVNRPVVENSERIYEVYTSANRWGVLTFPSYFAGKVVAVDYLLADPHIIGEELEIPPPQDLDGDGSPDPIPVRLSLTHLLDEPLSPFHPEIIAAVDMDSPIDLDGDGTPADPYTVREGIIDVDWKEGVVTFHPSLGGRRVRVYYKSADGVALVPLKSPSIYVQYFEPDGAHPTGQVIVGRDPTGFMARKSPFPRQFRFEAELNPKDGSLTLLFPPSEGGKAISVDYEWGAGAIERGEVIPIPEGGPYEATLQNKPVTLPLLSVRGVGLKVRVCWIDKGRVRKSEVDVVLPR